MRFSSLVPECGDSVCHWSAELKYPENITVGNGVAIGPGCCLGAHSPIILEDHVRVSRNVIIETAGLDLTSDLPRRHQSNPIRICRGAWIGAGAIVLGRVTVGENAVVGSGTVVTQDVPAGAIVVGARVRTLEQQVQAS